MVKTCPKGEKDKPWFDAGLWRIEIQPEEGRKFDEFLVLMKPGIKGADNSFQYCEIKNDTMAGVETPRSIVLFPRKVQKSNNLTYEFKGGRHQNHIILGMPAQTEATVRIGKKELDLETNIEGVLTFGTGPNETGEIQILF